MSSQPAENFAMTYPKATIETLSFGIRDELERLRKALIDSFFRSAVCQTDMIIKRKLGIFTSDVCGYYRSENKSNVISSDEFYHLPQLTYDDEEQQQQQQRAEDPLRSFRHICLACPLNFVLIDEAATSTSSSACSHVYMCDICHCTRALEDNMVRHLQTELHRSATNYLTDSATMVLNGCVRRSCLVMKKPSECTFDSMIVCPICCEPFSSVNACAMHSHLVHQLDHVYSIASLSQTFELRLKRDHACVDCGEQYKKLSLLVKHLDETGHGPHETSAAIVVFTCPIHGCAFRTKHFFHFKTHLMLLHSNAFQSLDGSIQIKVKRFIKPHSYMHVARFYQQNRTDIKEALHALEELESDMKQSPDNAHILRLIKVRYDVLNSL